VFSVVKWLKWLHFCFLTSLPNNSCKRLSAESSTASYGTCISNFINEQETKTVRKKLRNCNWGGGHPHTHTYTHTYMHTYICTYIYMYTHTYIYTYTYVYTYIYTYYVYIYIYSYIDTGFFGCQKTAQFLFLKERWSRIYIYIYKGSTPQIHLIYM